MNRSGQTADLLHTLYSLPKNIQTRIRAKGIIEHHHITPGIEQRQPASFSAVLDALCCVNCLRRIEYLFVMAVVFNFDILGQHPIQTLRGRAVIQFIDNHMSSI